MSSTAPLLATLKWYFSKVYGHIDGPGTLPFYCDPRRIGHFAVESSALAAGHSAALFKLFVCMAMYQARRDVVIMQQQASMSRAEVQSILSMKTLGRLVSQNPCPYLSSAAAFDAGCSVHKIRASTDCDGYPGAPCHVKDATRLLNRMGDMGKLPTSAWLHAWKAGRLAKLFEEVLVSEANPQLRAQILVKRFSSIYRIGEKLATMFVSALSTPALAPGLTPWFPAIDGNALVIVDTNVAQAIASLEGPPLTATYTQRANWIRQQARSIDLRVFDRCLPRFSPRLVQQALYTFCSKSNRLAQGNECPAGSDGCSGCVPAICPFVGRRHAQATN